MDDIDAELTRLVPDYLAARRRDLVTLRELLGRECWDDMRRIGHRMKGTGATYGFPDISRLGDAIEVAAQSADAGVLCRLFDQLDILLAAIEGDMK